MRWWILMGLIVVCTSGAGIAQKPPAKTPRRAQAADELRFAQQVIELTNRERAKVNLPPLRANPELTASAQWMAHDLAAYNYFAHEDHTGRSINRRLPDFGYTGYSAIGENIAGGRPTPAAVVNGWMHSAGHRANMLNPDFHEIGVGYLNAPQSKYRRIWVQDFGARFNEDTREGDKKL